MACSARQCSCTALCVGLGLLVVGLSLGLAWPSILQGIVRGKLQLTPNSTNYKLWVRTPIPMYLELYLFNWTNAEEFVRNKSVKPHFEEVGPFVFLEVHDRVNLTWNNNGTVSFNQTRRWTYMGDRSLGLDTEVTNLNVIAATVAYMTRFWHNPLYQMALNQVMNLEEHLVVTKPARQWLFDGMDDKLLTLLQTLKNLSNIPLPFDKFGFFYQRNMSASYDGRFTMFDGVGDLYKLGVLDRWDGYSNSPYYSGACGAVGGTTGELLPPLPPGPRSNITIFVPDICRSMTLSYRGPSPMLGLRGEQFVADGRVFDNGSSYPEAACYCRPGDECLPSGAVNASACRWGSPLFASYPHFYLADPSYGRAVSGMRPNKTEHEFYLTFQPDTGIPLEVRAQLQINMLVQPVPWLKMFRSMPRLVLPMLWFRQRATLTEDLAATTRLILSLPTVGAAVFYSLAGVGLLLGLARVALVLRRRRTQPPAEDKEVLISNDAAES